MEVGDVEKLKEEARKVYKFVRDNADLENDEFTTEEIKTAALVVGNAALNALCANEEPTKALSMLFVAQGLIRTYERDLELSRKSGHA